MIKVQQRQNFMDKADEMRRVYDKLAEDKRNVEGQRNIICQEFFVRNKMVIILHE